MARINVECPIPDDKLRWDHPLLQLVMLKSLKAQRAISEPVYLRCLALMHLPDDYGTLKERITGDDRS